MNCIVPGILQVRIWSRQPFPFPGDLPDPGIEPSLLHCRQILYQLSYKGSLRILEWVAYPFLQWIFLTQKSNWCLLHYRQILYQLSYKESPRILEWVAYPFLQWIFLTQE